MKRTEKLSRRARLGILAAIMAGAFSIMPAAQAMPTGGASGTATITTAGNTMDIASSVTNNLLTWQDFSVGAGETVNFQGANTYLNVVTGANQSQIFGAINGSEANVFLVNPNGILIGDGATVNVGSLHLSTADIKGSLANFDTAKAALDDVATFSGDVVNKGTLKAAQEITVDGNNITFKNTADVTSPQVTLQSTGNGEIHIGSADGSTPTNYTMNGTSHMYKLVSTPEDLQNIKNNLSGKYMLAGNIDMQGVAFTPIGSTSSPFVGRFDGLDYTISNLKVNITSDYAGLFSAIAKSKYNPDVVVENFSLTGGSVTTTGKGAGGVAGLNFGLIRNVRNANTVTATKDTAGGIIGTGGGHVENSVNTGTVESKGNVAGGIAGGLGYGLQQAAVIGSRNEGTVKGKKQVGGVVGYFTHGLVQNVSNAGNVEGARWVGGIIGHNHEATLNKAYNTGSVKISNPGSMNIGGVGGVVGANEGIVTNVYNEGDVSGRNISGGIVGLNGSSKNGYGVLQNAYNKGKVSVENDANTGGIVGLLVETDSNAIPDASSPHTTGRVENVYNMGDVTTTNTEKGAIAGHQKGGTISGAYFLCNLTNGVGRVDGGSQTTTQIADEAASKQTATYAGFSIDKDGTDSGAVWRIYEGKTTPLLTTFLTPLAFNDTTVIYDGQAHSVASLAKVDGTKILGGTLASYTEPGTYEYKGLSGLYSNQHGYNIKTSGDTATLTINKAPLTFGVSGYTKTYDGNTTATGGNYIVTNGLVVGGAGYIDVNIAYSDKKAGTDKAMTVSGMADKYIVKGVGNGNTINPAPLTIKFADINKQYDGTNNAVAGQGTLTGVIGEDSVSYDVKAAYDSKNAGSRTVNYSGIKLTGAEAGNYSIATETTGKGTINPAPLTFGAVDRVYDGTTKAPVEKGNLVGVIAGDDVSLSPEATGTYDGKDAGTHNIQYSGITLTGVDAKNYSIATETTGTGTITPATLTFNAADKVYDGTTKAPVEKGNLAGVIAGDDVSLSPEASGIYDGKDAGTHNVQYSGIKLTGADAGNYSIESELTGQAVIAPAQLTITFDAADKQYDGTTDAVVGKGTLTGIVGTEDVAYAAEAVTAAYDSKNAGSRTVTYSGIKLTGADAGNYSIAATAEGKGTINAAPLTLKVADVTKYYDGTTDALNASYSIVGTLYGDDTLEGGVFAYTDKNVGTGKTVTLTGVTAKDGNEGGNYDLTIINSTNSAITINVPEIEAVTITTQGDDQGNVSFGEQHTITVVFDNEGTLTLVNGGINPPNSMDAEKVAKQNKDTKSNGENKEGE